MNIFRLKINNTLPCEESNPDCVDRYADDDKDSSLA
jgi:hypothetical protein